jgi:hypothetical protein
MLCSGSFALEKHLKEMGKKRAASRGDKIHAALEGKLSPDALNHSDRICYERCVFEEGRLVELLNFEGSTVVRENRFWGFDGEGEPLFSAKPDVVYFSPDSRALIINYKTGHPNPHTGYIPVGPIEQNEQMFTEGTLVAYSEKFTIKSAIIALIHPNYALPDKSISQHTRLSVEELQSLYEKEKIASISALDENAERTPGRKQCEFCLGAKLKACPEFLASNLPK